MKKIIATFLLLVLMNLLFCSENEKVGADSKKQEAPATEQVLHDSQIVLSNKGFTTAVIEASYIEKRFGDNKTYARDITAHFYDSTGTETSRMTADSGEVIEDNNLLSVWGDVEVNTRDSIKLITESLRWDQAVNKVVSEAYVEVYSNNGVARGYGFVSDRTLKEFSITRQVSGEIKDLPRDSAK